MPSFGSREWSSRNRHRLVHPRLRLHLSAQSWFCIACLDCEVGSDVARCHDWFPHHFSDDRAEAAYFGIRSEDSRTIKRPPLAIQPARLSLSECPLFLAAFLTHVRHPNLSLIRRDAI